MPQPTLFPKLHASSGPPGFHSIPGAPGTFPALGHSQYMGDLNPPHQMYRTKRKHVHKACDRCRVKKTKCDGNQPCYRCAAYNHPCLFRERKATQTKTYSRGFVEMLEAQHALVVKGLQRLYFHCLNNKCFPGEAIEVVDGNPLTHAILDRLGLIKQAENDPEIPDSSAMGIGSLLGERRNSSSSEDRNDFSPEPNTESESSQSSAGTSIQDKEEFDASKYAAPPPASHGAYNPYQCSEHIWTLSGGSNAVTSAEPREADRGSVYYERHVSKAACASVTHSMARDESRRHHTLEREPAAAVAVGSRFSQAEHHTYASLPHQYQSLSNTFGTVGQPYHWNLGQ